MQLESAIASIDARSETQKTYRDNKREMDFFDDLRFEKRFKAIWGNGVSNF